MPEKRIKVILRSSNLKYEILNLRFSANEIEYLSLSGNVLHTRTGFIILLRILENDSFRLSANFVLMF